MGILNAKTIVVAGAGGIGGGLARRYAAEGANVVLGDLNTANASAIVADIARTGGTAIATRLDGADEKSIAAAVKLACETYGGLDGFHANFASFADHGDDIGVLDLALDVYDETMRVNARGFVLCTRLALPPMLERGGGAILYTSSGAAFIGEPTRLAYAMSKSAGHALMRHVAARYGAQGIRANCIAPGIIIHENWPEVTPEIEAWASSVALYKSRLGRPNDIAAMSALLMSDDGAFVTGQVISIDGGNTMRP